MPNRLRILLLLLVVAVKLQAQGPLIQWQSLFDAGGDQVINQVCRGNDGGYVAAMLSHGNSLLFPDYFGEEDCWIVKTDENGSLQWKTHIGGSGVDIPKSIIQVKAGGYLVVGYTNSYDLDISGKHGRDVSTDYWVIRLDDNGKILWQKCYGGFDYDYANSADNTLDGGFIVAGMAISLDGDVTGQHANGDCWILKLDANGRILWQRAVGGINPDVANSVMSEPDGSFSVLGFSFSGDGDVSVNNRSGNVWLFNMSPTGGMQWQHSFGGSQPDYGQQLIHTSDGGYLAGAYSYSPAFGNHGDADFYVIKLTADASIEWQRCFGGSRSETLNSVAESPDGVYVIAGNSLSNDGDVSGNHGFSDAWLLALDRSGAVIWQQAYGGSSYDQAFSVIQSNDSNLVFAGVTNSNDGDLSGFSPVVDASWLVKLGCQPVIASVSISESPDSTCAGDETSFNVIPVSGGTNPVYQWKLNGRVVGSNSTDFKTTTLADGDSIWCEMTSNQPCVLQPVVKSEVLVVSVKAKRLPLVSISTSSSSICKGAVAVFTASSNTDPAFTSYTWLVNGQPAFNGRDTAVFPALANGDVVSVMISAAQNCVADTVATSNAVTVTLSDAILPSVGINEPGSRVCAGDTVQFVATTTPGTGNFQWLVNRQPVGINSDLFTYKSSGSDTIACVYTTTGGCVAVVTSNLVVVNTVALPAVICMDDTSVTAGSVVTLYAAVNGNFATALWTSSTVITNATSPSGALSIPASTSTYRLTAYTPEGCSAYDETIVKVNFPPSATNAFSPNGDGINERWRLPIDAGCSSCFISIFDRYGREVFNSKSGNLYWNGELNGKALPAGVYYFTLKRAENKKTETGTVTILR